MQSESDRKALTRPPFVRVSERRSVCVHRRYIFKVGARVLCCCVSIMSLKGASMKKENRQIHNWEHCCTLLNVSLKPDLRKNCKWRLITATIY